MIRTFIRVCHMSGFPLTPWHVQLLNWPFVDETFAAMRDVEAAMMVAKQVASVHGLPIATPAHVVVSEAQKVANDAPQQANFCFWTFDEDYSDVEPEWNREDWVGE